jgi:hypothetical protein
MLYTRIRSEFKPHVNPRVFDISGVDEERKRHPLAEHHCPACGEPLVEDGRIVLVPVGIAPAGREDGGWTNAGCVAVHLACSGYTEADVEQLYRALLDEEMRG